MPDADEPKSLPLANIKRIIADNLPRDVKPHKDVVSMLQESTTSLIGLVVCEALDRTDLDGRRTISGDDLIDSLRALDFDDTYIGTLSAFLTAYRMRRKAIKEGTAGVHPMDDDDEELDEEDDE